MAINNVISDMDGVLYRGKMMIPGVSEFIERLLHTQTPFLFLTNNSEQTALDLKNKLEGMGITGLSEAHFFTSAMATAEFLKSQHSEQRTAYVVGGGGLINELYSAGFSITDKDPEYVVVGMTRNINFDMLNTSINLIRSGAKFIATNPDMIDPVESGVAPAAGTILAAIAAGSGRAPYIVGKPNAIMMMLARKRLGAHAAETLMIGDRMDTDIVSGMEAGMATALVLSGVSDRKIIKEFPYRPTWVFNTVEEIDIARLEP